jgi:hypothetical protein
MLLPFPFLPRDISKSLHDAPTSNGAWQAQQL